MWKKLMSGKKVCSPFQTMNVLSLQWIRTTMFFQSVKDLKKGLNDPMTPWKLKRRVKSAFTFFQSLSRIFMPIFCIKSRRNLLQGGHTLPLHLYTHGDIRYVSV